MPHLELFAWGVVGAFGAYLLVYGLPVLDDVQRNGLDGFGRITPVRIAALIGFLAIYSAIGGVASLMIVDASGSVREALASGVAGQTLIKGVLTTGQVAASRIAKGGDA